MANENMNLVPTWKVSIGGTDIDSADFKGTLRRVTVSDVINGVGAAVLEFDAKYEKKEVLKENDIKTENAVIIKLGYKDNVHTVFNGFITGIETELRANNNEVVRLICTTILYKTRNGHRIVAYENKSYKSIISEILKKYGMELKMQEDMSDMPYTLQNEMTDFDY